MKTISRYICFLIWTLVTIPSFSYSQWVWQNPLPQGNSALNLQFINEATGYVVGNCGTILKTTNGGESWTLQTSNTNLNLSSIHMTSENSGFIIGHTSYSDDTSSIILKTVNGGMNWSIVKQDSFVFYNSVYCATNDTIFVACNKGILLQSFDGGINWTSLQTGIRNNILQITFPTPDIGYAIADSCKVIKTTNGGLSWEQIIVNVTSPAKLVSMSFPTGNIGYILVYDDGPGKVLKTMNGGVSWSTVLTSSPTPYSIDFCTPLIGYVAAAGADYKTINGGISWQHVTSSYLWASHIELISSDIAYSVAGSETWGLNNPLIFKTLNGGTKWNLLTSSVANGSITNLVFPEENIGYALCTNMIEGMVLKTTDGHNWDTVLFQETRMIDMKVLNENTIWFCGDYQDSLYETVGVFGKSIDGGLSWDISDLNNSIVPKSIYITSLSTGYLLASDGLYKTINSGLQWQKIHSDTTMNLYQVYFSSANDGFILKNSYEYSFSLLLKTTDAGASWEQIKQFDHQMLRPIFFLNDDDGFLLTDAYPDTYFHTTTDGGLTWTTDTIRGISLTNLYFSNDSAGCLVGFSGEILQTKDGGKNWHVNNMVTDNFLLGVFFIDENRGYVSGRLGTILYTDSCITRLDSKPVGLNESTLWIFPNPSSGEINISYNIDKSSQVLLEIVNLSGQTLKKIVDARQENGNYTYLVDAQSLVPGAYIVQLRKNNISHTRVALIK